MMRWLVLWIIGSIGAGQIAAAGTAIPTNEVDGTFDSSSYDTPPYVLWGDYFASHFYDMYPQFTNHIYSVSRPGASWAFQLVEDQEMWCLPLWASFGTLNSHDWMLANDNDEYVSNDVILWGTNLFNAPMVFWDGTAFTNEGGIASTLSVTHYSLGGIPADAPDGDGGGGAISRNAGAMKLAELYGTPVVDMWHLLWTNGLSTDIVGKRLFGFYYGGHPYPAGHLCMAIQCLVALGAETNVGSLTLNWSNSSAATNHCVASGVTVSGDSLTCTVHYDRMPMAWDVPDGTITNDARNAFVVSPELGNAFQWIIRVTNAPPGTYAINVDGVPTDVATSAQLAAGRNWFTNYSGPLWAQRVSVLAWKRSQAACDPVTLEPSHDASTPGLLGVDDLLNFQSDANQNYNSDGLRGDAYIDSMANDMAGLREYDHVIRQAAQQTNHMLSITMIGVPTILAAPQNAVTAAHAAVSFSVGLGGATPFSYQWFFNGTKVSGATNASYTIAADSDANAGYYQVVAANAFGSVTSSVASLALVGITLDPANDAGVSIYGPLGASYSLQSIGQIAGTDWNTLTNVSLPSQPFIYVDYGSRSNTQQFYRYVPLP